MTTNSKNELNDQILGIVLGWDQILYANFNYFMEKNICFDVGKLQIKIFQIATYINVVIFKKN